MMLLQERYDTVHQPHVSGADSMSFTGCLPCNPESFASCIELLPTMTLRKSLTQSRLNLTSQKVGGPIYSNMDRPESKVSSTAAVNPSSDVEAHKRGKRYVLYRFLNIPNELNVREYPAPPTSQPLIQWEHSGMQEGMLICYFSI